MEQWSAEQCEFIVETFFNVEPVVKTQRIFRKHFNIVRNGKVPWPNTAQLWVENFIASASA
jgi:hypothetical protein